jgi:type VII secretion protein EccE
MEFFVVAGLAVGQLLNWPRWYGAAAGLGAALMVVVPVRGLSLPRWASVWLGFWYARHRRGRRIEPERREAFDEELADGSRIGFHWDGKILMSVMRIVHEAPAVTIMEPATTVWGQTISARVLADCLQHFDIALDSIDVISQGARSRSRGQIGSVYEAVLGPLPATAQRSVWVTVRLDPTRCAEAVRHRGGGWQGMVRTAATATRRVANRLSDAGLQTEILTADGIAHAIDELSHGRDVSTLDETWLACRDARFELRTYCLAPSILSTAGIGRLWTVPSSSTTMCISLRRDERDDLIKLRGLVRFDGHGQSSLRLRELDHLPGRQYAALMCSLPAPSPRRSVPGWVIAKGVDAVGDLELPVSGCGQVVGADEQGRAVALPLFGPRAQRVELCGTLHLAQQVVLRSLALGASVRVYSRRPAAWQAMVEQVGDHDLLRVNDRRRESIAANGSYPVEMFDGASEPTIRQGITTMVVRPPHAEPSREADVALRLVDHTRDLVRVHTRSASATVTMVATPDEMRYIQASLDVVE